MLVSDYLVDFLIKKNVKTVFGVPGTIILDFLYALKRRKEINVELSYHEQCAAFEACGYSQFNYELGVAYATKGPGATNLITGIAEAYSDSLPVLFITSHSINTTNTKLRFEKNQELDVVNMVKGITKYSDYVDDLNEVEAKLSIAYESAMSGRKGPVFLDFSSKLWSKEILPYTKEEKISKASCPDKQQHDLTNIISSHLSSAKRPVFLLGDGIHQSKLEEKALNFLNVLRIPVLSSYAAQDLLPNQDYYFGYVGSHGNRYSNFIIEKSDLVISLGNRMSFPKDSKSFNSVFYNKKVIRLDVDSSEFEHEIPNSLCYQIELDDFFSYCSSFILDNYNNNFENWLKVCSQIKAELQDYDITEPVKALSEILTINKGKSVLVGDIGCNSFWLARAYEYTKTTNRLLRSKSFNALGCGIAKAIGTVYSSGKSVICVVGDQGFQFNVQELQLISNNRLPIAILIINNNASGIIRISQSNRFNNEYIHTTESSGYTHPDFSLLAKSYHIDYYDYDIDRAKLKDVLASISKPVIIDIHISETLDVTPHLPLGNCCSDLSPELDRKLIKKLHSM